MSNQGPHNKRDKGHKEHKQRKENKGSNQHKHHKTHKHRQQEQQMPEDSTGDGDNIDRKKTQQHRRPDDDATAHAPPKRPAADVNADGSTTDRDPPSPSASPLSSRSSASSLAPTDDGFNEIISALSDELEKVRVKISERWTKLTQPFEKDLDNVLDALWGQQVE